MHAALSADLAPGRGITVTVGGRRIALFHDETRGILATDDTCPHEDASLGEGLFHAGRVICRRHGWIFDAASGACLNIPGVRLACYATRPAGDGIEVELPDEAEGERDAGQAGA